MLVCITRPPADPLLISMLVCVMISWAKHRLPCACGCRSDRRVIRGFRLRDPDWPASGNIPVCDVLIGAPSRSVRLVLGKQTVVNVTVSKLLHPEPASHTALPRPRVLPPACVDIHAFALRSQARDTWVHMSGLVRVDYHSCG
eukprot:40646-Prorocentrum_minimum.AAC.1